MHFRHERSLLCWLGKYDVSEFSKFVDIQDCYAKLKDYKIVHNLTFNVKKCMYYRYKNINARCMSNQFLIYIFILAWGSQWLISLNTHVPRLIKVNIYYKGKANLHNYFNLHVCPSFRRRRRRPTFVFPIPAVVLQSVTDKSCLICVKSKRYAFLVTTRPLGSMRWGEAELHTLWH